MNEEEKKILNKLGEVWNMFNKLPELHPWSKVEFMHKIHDCQYLIMSRPSQRQINQEE